MQETIKALHKRKQELDKEIEVLKNILDEKIGDLNDTKNLIREAVDHMLNLK